jgi:hypothetical protein
MPCVSSQGRARPPAIHIRKNTQPTYTTTPVSTTPCPAFLLSFAVGECRSLMVRVSVALLVAQQSLSATGTAPLCDMSCEGTRAHSLTLCSQ